jgi:hypothetical protein
MRAWQLGVIITIIGVGVILYATYTSTSIFDINSLYISIIGFFIFLLGIGIRGIKFRQWIEHH